jgi:Flp pilus assembly protein TadG
MFAEGKRGLPRERGAVAVEFALLVPVLLALVFGTIAYSYMFSFRQTLSQAASEGARAAVGAPTSGTCNATGPFTSACPAQYAASQGVQRALSDYNMACGSNNLTCTISAPTTAGCSTGHSCISVSVGYPYRDHQLMETVPGFGFTLPGNLAFSSVVELS